mgnify:FL=1
MGHISIEKYNDVNYPSKNEMLYPNKNYIELPFEFENYSENNKIFEMVRDGLKDLKMDIENYGKKEWNPFKGIIKEDNNILIKPNLVMHKNGAGFGEECLYTSPSLVAAIIPYIYKALNGKGKITIADAPMQSCDFQKLIEDSGYKELVQYYKNKGINIELKDLRGLISKEENGVLKQEISSGNSGGVIVDLGKNSEHAKLDKKQLRKIRITNYNPDELLQHHNINKHEYFIAKEALEADVIIDMPKPKAHRKAGVTISLKNFVGINTRKEYLPHHRFGDKKHGGDEYEKNSLLLKISSRLLDLRNMLQYKKMYILAKIINKISNICERADKKFFSKEQNREGSWHGNDTIWRTIIDINRIIKYADKEGKLCDTPQRKIFAIADMIIVGEKEGPLLPSPKYGGIIAMGEDLVCFDEVVATILGLDINKIPLFQHLREKRKYPIVKENEHALIVSNSEKLNNKAISQITREEAINIEPSSGWKGYIEIG